MIELYSPALAGAKLNLPVFQKLQKARQLVPVGADFRLHAMPLFLNVLLEKLNAKYAPDMLAMAGQIIAGKSVAFKEALRLPGLAGRKYLARW